MGAINDIIFEGVCPVCNRLTNIRAQAHIGADFGGDHTGRFALRTYRLGDKMAWWERDDPRYDDWRAMDFTGLGLRWASAELDEAVECCAAECERCGWEHDVSAVIRFRALRPVEVIRICFDENLSWEDVLPSNNSVPSFGIEPVLEIVSSSLIPEVPYDANDPWSVRSHREICFDRLGLRPVDECSRQALAVKVMGTPNALERVVQAHMGEHYATFFTEPERFKKLEDQHKTLPGGLAIFRYEALIFSPVDGSEVRDARLWFRISQHRDPSCVALGPGFKYTWSDERLVLRLDGPALAPVPIEPDALLEQLFRAEPIYSRLAESVEEVLEPKYGHNAGWLARHVSGLTAYEEGKREVAH
jgi:hypothetical protein